MSPATSASFQPNRLPSFTLRSSPSRKSCAPFARTKVKTSPLETGQESAATLLALLRDADQPNLRVNFDSANMILYGSGDPIEALDLLQNYVLSVHCKDGRSPRTRGTLGTECALGEGEVDFPASSPPSTPKTA